MLIHCCNSCCRRQHTKLDSVPLCIVNHCIKIFTSVSSLILPFPAKESKPLTNNRTGSADYNVSHSPVSGNQAQRRESYTSQREQRSQCVIEVVQEIQRYRKVLWTMECAGAECTSGIS